MRFSPTLIALVCVGAAACGPTYVVQSTPVPTRVQVQAPPRVEPLGVSIVRPEDARVLVQTSRPAYVAVFEIVPGRGVSLVYPQPYRPRDVELTGLTWLNVSWTMRYEYARHDDASDTRYIYTVASDTPLRIEDSDYDRSGLERRLGSTFYSSSPNATVHAISREFVRSQPDEWWGEDLFTMSMAPVRDRIVISVRMARVYCPGGSFFEVRDDIADHVWCPPRVVARGRPPVTEAPDSVFGSNGHRVPRHMDPSARTPVFRVPAATDVGQQQGQPHDPPHEPPRNVPPTFPPRTQPTNPQIPTTNQPPRNQPPQNQPPQNQPPQTQPPVQTPPQNQPPVQTPPQNQPPQTQPQDTAGKGNNGRRAHGDPRNADPRGNGNGYGNGGRTQQPSTQPPATQPPSQSNPQPPQQGQGQQNQPNSNGHGNGNGNNANGSNSANGNNGNHGNNGNNGNHGNSANASQDNAPKNSIGALLKRATPQPPQKQDDKNKKAASDSSDKKKP